MAEDGASGDRRAVVREGEIDILNLLEVLARSKRLLFGFPLLVGLVTLVAVFLMPNVYTATARLVPPQASQSATTMLLGQVTNLLGTGGNGIGLKSSTDLYVGVLKSRSIADRLVERFALTKVYDRETLTLARKDLAGNTVILAGRDGIIVVEVDDRDPERAAAMANAYGEELIRVTQSLALTEASQRRLFFEKQLKQTKIDLAEAETELRKTQETTGVIRLEEQGKAIIEAIARIRGQISAKEVQLGAMRAFATDRNPELALAQRELAGMREQLGRLERSAGSDGSGIFVPTRRVPEAALEYLRSLRDVKYHETVFELLAKQFEIAKIDEAREAAVVQVLDAAVVPEIKSRPKRALITLLASTIAGILAAVWILTRESLRRRREWANLTAPVDNPAAAREA